MTNDSASQVPVKLKLLYMYTLYIHAVDVAILCRYLLPTHQYEHLIYIYMHKINSVRLGE